MNNIIQFPTFKRMPSTLAEEFIGDICNFRYNSGRHESIEQWTNSFLVGKYVLVGHEALNCGLIKCFKDGARCHRIFNASGGEGAKPIVRVHCSRNNLKIYNWDVIDLNEHMSDIAILLTDKQASFFMKCKRCVEKEDIIY